MHDFLTNEHSNIKKDNKVAPFLHILLVFSSLATIGKLKLRHFGLFESDYLTDLKVKTDRAKAKILSDVLPLIL